MELPDFIDRIMHMPFVDRGRDYSGGDCWAVVWLLWRDVLGRDLPAYDTGYDTAGASAWDRATVSGLVESEAVNWRRVDAPQLGDVALLRCGGRLCHVGAMIDPQRFLHIETRQGAMIERLSAPLWARRCEGVYRRAD